MSRAAIVLGLVGSVVVSVAACGKRPVEPSPDASAGLPSLTPAVCAREVESLRAWMRVVANEGDVFAEVIPDPADADHYLDRPLPGIPLVRLAARPDPAPQIGLATLHRGQLRFADSSASVSNGGAVLDVLHRLDASSLAPSFGFGGVGGFASFKPILLWVGASERWADVVAVVEALARDGFSEVFFGFEATSAVAPPPPAIRPRLLAIETDARTMPYVRDRDAARELARSNPRCPGVAAAFAVDADDSTTMDDQRTAFIEQAPEAVRACGCRVDRASIESFTWVRYGREWGRATISYSLAIAGSDDPERGDAVEIAARPDTPWSDAYPPIVDAAMAKARAVFVSR